MLTLINPTKLLAAIAICTTIWALIDCFKYERLKPKMWMFVIIFFGVFGAVPYFLIAKRKRQNKA